MDLFVKEHDKGTCNISYFATKKVFEDNVKDLLRIKELIKYKRRIPQYSPDKVPLANRLLHEYLQYLNAISLTEEDIERKKEILKTLEEYGSERRT